MAKNVPTRYNFTTYPMPSMLAHFSSGAYFSGTVLVTHRINANRINVYSQRYVFIFTVKMLSPKMQRCVRVVDNQLLMLSDRARTDSTLTGNLHKKASDGGRWKSRYFVLYQVSQTLLFLPNVLP